MSKMENFTYIHYDLFVRCIDRYPEQRIKDPVYKSKNLSYDCVTFVFQEYGCYTISSTRVSHFRLNVGGLELPGTFSTISRPQNRTLVIFPELPGTRPLTVLVYSSHPTYLRSTFRGSSKFFLIQTQNQNQILWSTLYYHHF